MIDGNVNNLICIRITENYLAYVCVWLDIQLSVTRINFCQITVVYRPKRTWIKSVRPQYCNSNIIVAVPITSNIFYIKLISDIVYFMLSACTLPTWLHNYDMLWISNLFSVKDLSLFQLNWIKHKFIYKKATD